MKKLKNALFLLLAGVTILFSACEETETEPILFEPEIPGELSHYDLTTLTPDINQDRVLFQAELNTDDQRISYGFMWYIKSNNGNPTVHTLEVGEGAHSGNYSLATSNLPRGVDLVVCSYVRLELASGTSEQIAEELEFGWD